MLFRSVVYGQKSYNGVAILSKFRIEDVIKGLPNYKDEQSRYIEALIITGDQVIRVASIYVPNGGGELGSDEKLEDSAKFKYKMEFMQNLELHLSSLIQEDELQIFAGDFNVAVESIDCYDSKNAAGKILFHDLERKKMREIMNLGYIDSFRNFNEKTQAFSWWDYRGNAWQYNKGFRIDYLLLSPKATDILNSANIEADSVRDQQKASDHCPVCVMLTIS